MALHASATTMGSCAYGEAKKPTIHAVRKSPAKLFKKPAPEPPKVYNVDPTGFRHLVQRLTGALSGKPKSPRFRSGRLRSLAPPPVNQVWTSVSLSSSPLFSPETLSPAPDTAGADWSFMEPAANEQRDCKSSGELPGQVRSGSLSFSSPESPDFLGSWGWSLPLFSPSSMLALEHHTIL